MKLGKWWMLGAPLLGLAVLAVVLWLQPAVKPATAGELAEVAIGYLKAGKLDLARESFRQALDLEPQNHRALYGFGQLAFQEHHLPEAEELLKRAYQADPKDVDTILTLGAVYQKGKAYKQAEMLYQAVRKVQPGNASVVYNLGLLEIDTRHYEKSRAYFEEYLRMVPRAPDRGYVERKIALLAAHIKEQQSR